MADSAASWREQMRRDQQALRQRDRWRSLCPTTAHGPTLEVDGKTLINLAGNDYLGLAAAAEGGAKPICGAGASRLVTGNDPAFQDLEETVADWLDCEAAVAFASGYMANAGIMPALANRHDMIFSDRLNHASIIDGIRLSRAKMTRYRHLDAGHLEEQLAASVDSDCRRRLIITESLFSMDGDRAPLTEIAALAARYDAILVIDEAHATGILGPAGRGLAAAAGVTGDHVLRLLTFGKGFGLYGACAAGSRLLCDELINHARTLIYTTGLPPALIECLTARVETVAAAGALRQTLADRCQTFREGLAAHQLDAGGALGPIFPIVIGGDADALAVSRQLRERGIWATAIRPPTVPEGTARLRCTVTAQHDEATLETAIAAVAEVIEEVMAA